jgi:DNA polymerase-4
MMMLGLNSEAPQVMHIDLNSAFATTEQQAHRSLRGKPMGVTNRISKHCCVIAASYEAKDLGIRVGMRLDEARAICPTFVILETDPPKYHLAYQKLGTIMKSYSPNIAMKSIDEGIIDFHGTLETVHRGRSLEAIGYEIKQRVKDDIGHWMRINIGIGPNRFLAKQAAGWHKPDGLDSLEARNLLAYYETIELSDLSGIASHYSARLNAANIFTPRQFLNASSDTLRRLVFHSSVGDDWYRRLRGHEIDANPTNFGNVGRQWVLAQPSADATYLLPCFQYLCETTGKKLRYQGRSARGIIVWCRFQTGDNWVQRKMFKSTFFTDSELYRRALYLFNQRPKHLIIQTMGVTCYQLTASDRNQTSLLETVNREDWLTTAVDDINDRYGTLKIFHANTLHGTKTVKQKIPFGGTRYFELLLKDA